ncbi:MAG: hypothetical protein JW753_00750 [Dehalococcoidia bacterium]|nr:hypothetical protein [Dehalococcoidia bacterium]
MLQTTAQEVEVVKDYFNVLEDWKRLPAYRLEVRIDSLVGFALPRVLERLYGYKTAVTIPELPIRVGTVHHQYEGKDFADRSYKVDFFVLTECRRNIFVEFKTDSGSRRTTQDDYLRTSVKLGMKAIVDGIIRISEVSTYKKKYSHLLQKLQDVGLVVHDGNHVKSSVQETEITVLYVQPKILADDDDKNIIDFETLGNTIGECYPDSILMCRLAESISGWGND